MGARRPGEWLWRSKSGGRGRSERSRRDTVDRRRCRWAGRLGRKAGVALRESHWKARPWGAPISASALGFRPRAARGLRAPSHTHSSCRRKYCLLKTLQIPNCPDSADATPSFHCLRPPTPGASTESSCSLHCNPLATPLAPQGTSCFRARALLCSSVSPGEALARCWGSLGCSDLPG